MGKKRRLTSIEICAGAGGQALGLELAGFDHLALVEIEAPACATLRYNRPLWNVLHGDVRHYDAKAHLGQVDLFAGGVPCPPFSIAGKQLGSHDERDLFPEALRLIEECRPKAILLENVRGLLGPKFKSYREEITQRLEKSGYVGEWKLITSSDFGVAQLRPRAILVAFKKAIRPYFQWPEPQPENSGSIGSLLYNEMSKNGWSGAKDWRQNANGIGPTLVGGSKKHGGADLGPTRARKAWAELGVDGRGLANDAPAKDFVGMPRLTLEMTALVQGFPESWHITGKKTPAYRQVGNAFPPPVAKAIGESIKTAIHNHEQHGQKEKGRASKAEGVLQ